MPELGLGTAGAGRALLELTIGLLVWAAVTYRLEREETASGVLFWRRIGLSVVLAALAAVLAEGPLAGVVEMAALALAAFALEQRPDRGAVEEGGRLDGWAVVALLAIGVLYLTPAGPPPFPEARSIVAPVLALALAARFAGLVATAHGGRWRTAYGGLAVAAGTRAAAALVATGSAAAATLNGVTALAIVGAALASRRAAWRVRPASLRADGRHRSGAAFLLLAALAPPLAHLVLGGGALPGAERTFRTQLAVDATAFLAVLSLLDLRSRERARRHAERRLRASERRYRFLVEADPDALLVLRGGRAVPMNRPARDLLRLAPGFRERLRELAAGPRTGGDGGGGVVELAVSAVDGERRDLEVVLEDPGDGATARVRDVTAARRREGEAERLRGLALVGELAASIAHEVRNPLAAVVFNLRFVEERHGIPPEASARLTGAVDRLQRIVSRVLAYTRQEEARPEVVDVGERVALAMRARGAEPVGGPRIATGLHGRIDPGTLDDVLREVLEAAGSAGAPAVEVAGVDGGVEVAVEAPAPTGGDAGLLLDALLGRTLAAQGCRYSVDRSPERLAFRVWIPEPDR